MKNPITITNRTQEVADKELNKLFDELVPATGKADTKAGEIVRAMAKLSYRYFNDGDQLGNGYGKETCNPAGRFLCDKLPEIEDTLCGMCGYGKIHYKDDLLKVQNYVIDYILANPQLKEEKNEEDYLNWRNEEEDVDDTEEDYEESLEEEEEW